MYRADAKDDHYLKHTLISALGTYPDILSFLEEGSLDGLWIWDMQHPDAQWMSPQFVRSLGYEPEEVPHLATWWQARVFEEDMPSVVDTFERHKNDPEHPYDQVIRYHHRDGSTVWIRCRGIIVRQGDGTPQWMIGANTNLTEVMKRQDQLAKREAELHFIFDHLPARIWLKDDANTILRLNQTAAASVGRSVKDVEGRHTGDVFKDLAPSYHRDDLAVLASGKPHRGEEVPFIPNSGKQGWSRTDKYPFKDPFTGLRRVLIVANDITDQVEARTALEAKNKTLERFTSAVSHDLRAHLRHIAMFSMLAKDALDEGDTAEARANCDQITTAAEDLMGMVQAILKFSKSAYKSAHRVRQPIGPVAQDAWRLVAETHPAQAPHFTVEGECTAAFDAALMRQVFQNLYDNALKYSGRPDTQIRVALEKDGERMVKIAVGDNGPGIPPEAREDIFMPFRQIHQSAADREGVGLGLPLCSQIVLAHGGQMHVEACPLGGADFIVTLPIA